MVWCSVVCFVVWCHGKLGRDRMFHLKMNAVQNFGRMFVLCARFLDDVQVTVLH